MRLYLDTNVYKFIAEKGEAEAVRGLLEAGGHAVEASGFNLFELYPCPDPAVRSNEIRTLTTVATTFRQTPETYDTACEFIAEVQRCRPGFLHTQPSNKTIELHLRQFRERWPEARKYPGLKPTYFRSQHRNLEAVIARNVDVQKAWRKARLDYPPGRLVVRTGIPELDSILLGWNEVELHWRHVSLQAWATAMKGDFPQSRDLRDWFKPYVRSPLQTFGNYQRMWYLEFDAERLPLHRVHGIASFYQERQRVSHGNTVDLAHAFRLLEADVMITADVAFHKVLVATSQHFSRSAVPLLIKRSAQSPAGEILDALATLPRQH